MIESTIKGYAFIEDNNEKLRVLCVKPGISLRLELHDWDSNLDSKTIAIYWFTKLEELVVFLNSANINIEYSEEVIKAIKGNQLMAVRVEITPTGEIYII